MFKPALAVEKIAPLVLSIRHEKILLDFHLAELYGVETRALKQAVRRNRDRFPADFMFELSEREEKDLVSQNVIPRRGKLGGAKPMAFTEQGRRDAFQCSAFPPRRRREHRHHAHLVQLRRLMDSNRELGRKIEALERKYDQQFALVFEAIKQLVAEDQESKTAPAKRIGFHQDT
jgi:hypothetical protein